MGVYFNGCSFRGGWAWAGMRVEMYNGGMSRETCIKENTLKEKK